MRRLVLPVRLDAPEPRVTVDAEAGRYLIAAVVDGRAMVVYHGDDELRAEFAQVENVERLGQTNVLAATLADEAPRGHWRGLMPPRPGDAIFRQQRVDRNQPRTDAE